MVIFGLVEQKYAGSLEFSTARRAFDSIRSIHKVYLLCVSLFTRARVFSSHVESKPFFAHWYKQGKRLVDVQERMVSGFGSWQ